MIIIINSFCKIQWYVIIACMFLVSCKKQDDFLNAVPSSNLAVPKTLNDLQLIIQDEGELNNFDPSLNIVSSDEFVVPYSLFTSVVLMQQNAYTWAPNIYPNQDVTDWTRPYQQIYYANTVLDYLNIINWSSNDLEQAKALKGDALFFRAKAYFNLISLFAKPYDSIFSKTDLGIPLRVSSDLNQKIYRATVQEGYDQIINDLQAALLLLPAKSKVFTLPDNAVASGFLARVYLAVSDYKDAYKQANYFLEVHNKLTDYNLLPIVAGAISNDYLSEDIFHSTSLYYRIAGNAKVQIDSSIYNSYETNDLRKTKFFYDFGYGPNHFVGTYDVYNNSFYDGIAVDEIFLIRAECSARMGNKSAALSDLNTLLVSRYKTGTFVPRETNNLNEILDQILVERKKELIFRGTRWTDLRRLNKDPRYEKTLTRNINGVVYSLPPNDPKYVLPIPDNEIELSGIQQNPR